MTSLVRLCPASGKHTHSTFEAAVPYALRRSRATGRPFRIYACPHCTGFHLTKRATWTERRAAA